MDLTLYLVRHGQCYANIELLLTGQLDSPLTDLGLKQASAIGERLAREPISDVYASDLSRAFVTGKHIARRHGLQPIPSPLLRECSMGVVTGMTLPEFEARFPEEYRLWREDGLNHRPPGGERFAHIIARTKIWLDQIIAGSSHRETIVSVSHAGTIAALLCAALNLPEAAFVAFDTDNASLSRLRYNGRWSLDLLNDTSHLCGLPVTR